METARRQVPVETASFGEWVRRRRRALDLTQAELADRVACATVTVRKVESDERRPSKVMAQRLADALELDEKDVARFLASARSERSPARLGDPADGVREGPGALPAPATRLIGREVDVVAVLDRLEIAGGPARLVTVTGPAGAGKTRLAVEVAVRAGQKFDLPVVFVDLSAVESPADVPGCIAGAVATPPGALVDATTLAIHALRRTPSLVVLDNFEHVLRAAGEVEALLESCPATICLVTSRAPLELTGEHQYPLGPLAADWSDGSTLLPPAVELFVERALAVDPHLELAHDTATIAAVCELLDGLPLAIELAARRTGELSPRSLLRALGEGGPLGEVPRTRNERHRSVDAAVAWSVELLSPGAREMLAACSVFPGGFAAHAAGELAGVTQPEAERALDEAHSHGLLRRRGARTGPHDAGRTYHMFIVVREHGRRRLDDTGRLLDTRLRHAELTARRAEEISPGIDAWPEPDVVDALVDIEADVRTALEWSFADSGSPAVGRRLLGAIAVLWFFRSQSADLLRWAEQAHRSLGPTDGPPQRCRCAYYLAVASWQHGDAHHALELIDEAVTAAEAAEEPTWLAETVGMHQMILLSALQLDAAAELTGRSIATALAAGAEWELLAHLRAARLALLGGDLPAATAAVDACLDAAARAPSTWGVAMVLSTRGDLLLGSGEPRAALVDHLDAFEGFLRVGAPTYAIARASSVASALVAAGRFERAAAVFSLVDEWCAETGAPLHPMVAFSDARDRAAVGELLGERFEELLEQHVRLEDGSEELRRLATG
jgi:predicted ATPase/transcriptional regulator with XRE-family HTH domain